MATLAYWGCSFLLPKGWKLLTLGTACAASSVWRPVTVATLAYWGCSLPRPKGWRLLILGTACAAFAVWHTVLGSILRLSSLGLPRRIVRNFFADSSLRNFPPISLEPSTMALPFTLEPSGQPRFFVGCYGGQAVLPGPRQAGR